MKQLLFLLYVLPAMMTSLSFDFGTTCKKCNDWFVVLDGVMGGLSTGTLEKKENSFVLSGEVSLENNGGFASIRTPYASFDLSDYTTVSIRYRSTGQDFAFTLNKYRRFWYPNYKTNLPMTNGEWAQVTFTLREFEKYRLGRKMQGNPGSNDLADIIRLGFISNTKAATTYSFEVDFVKFE